MSVWKQVYSKTPLVFEDPAFGGGGMIMGAAGGGGGFPVPPPVNTPSSGALAAVDRVRTVFPETWLWTNSTSGYQLQCNSDAILSIPHNLFRKAFAVSLVFVLCLYPVTWGDEAMTLEWHNWWWVMCLQPAPVNPWLNVIPAVEPFVCSMTSLYILTLQLHEG